MFHTLYTQVFSLLRSRHFFFVAVGLLIVQSAWIALTARYPQAFDENYHLGLIQLHAKQLLPFFTSQPPNADIYGAIVRDPSYLFHYLLSFPYQLIVALTDNLTVQIIILRFINIAVFVWGLFAYRALFNALGVSTALRNAVLLFFVLTPVVPLLAAQINYDNLMFTLTGFMFLYAVRYIQALERSKSDRQAVPLMLVMQVVFVAAVGSLVKFPFAPLAAAVMVILAYLTWKHYRRSEIGFRGSWKFPSKPILIIFTALISIVVLLCIERYGVNLVRYHAPVPKCDQVLSVEQCLSYSPWARDHMFAATYPSPSAQGIAVYPVVWFHRMVYETMFTITSYYYVPTGTVTYKPYPPLTIANYTAWTAVTAGVIAALFYIRKLWNYNSSAALRVLLLAISFYSLVLFVQNFAMYLHSGEAVAIHGRYFVPFFPVIYVALALAISWLLTRQGLERIKPLILTAAIVLLLQGGGITNWIIKSDSAWYWQHNQTAEQANWYAKNVLNKVIVRW